MTEAKRFEKNLRDAEMIEKMSDESLEALLAHLEKKTSKSKASKDSKAPKKLETPKASEAPKASKDSDTPVWKEVRGLLLKILVIILLFVTIFTFMFGAYRNTDPYMTPMVKSGDLILYYRLDKDYAIGDLLLLEFQGERQVRRVVAKEGDEVDISEEGLHINGALQQEFEIYQETWTFEEGVTFPITVGEGQVFVLGDTREDAIDSRIYGSTDVKDTLGTVMTIVRRRNL